MTSGQLFKAHLNQIWENSGSLFGKLIIAIPVGVVVVLVMWVAMKIIQTKCSPDSKAFRTITERKGWILGLGFYIAILIQMGVISRTPGSVSEMVWIPFQTSGGDYLVVLYSLANLVIFIPFGILVPKVFRRVDSVWAMALVTLMTSVVIEIVQFILSCGYSEVEDVIMNMTGGVIGYLIIKFIEKRKNEKRERVEN